MLKRIVVTAGIIIISTVTAFAFTDAEIAEAIRRAENSARYPYGIKSIDTHGDVNRARTICINTVRHRRAKWSAENSEEDFIAYLARDYTATDRQAWIKNVNYFLKHPK